jgi:two-component system nitrate/nitrite response regulator NarL
MRVLICDDHAVFGESLAELLAAEGVQVTAVATDPDQAVTILRRSQVDICLLDVMFGRESVLPRLADFHRLAPDTRVVLLTGQVDDDLVRSARLAHVRGVTDKRRLVRDIVQVLDRVHAGEEVFPRAGAPIPASRPVNPTPAQQAQRLASFLTPRERQTLRALVSGADTRKLARTLGVAPATARCHIQQVLTKLGAHSRLEAATTAVRCGLISPETGDWVLPRH